MLCAEFSMLLEAGLTINEGIMIMMDDKVGKEEQAILQGLLDSLEMDNPLSVALKESGAFPRYMEHMVGIGEKTGRLVESLTALSEYYDRQERLAVAIKSSVLYPAILLILMIAVVLVLIVQVLPIFNDMFSRLGAVMSPLAIRLMQFGEWIGGAAVVIAAILCVVFIVVFLSWLFLPFRMALKGIFMNRWGNSGVFGQIATTRFVSSMTLAMASGLDIDEAVDSASAISGGSRVVDRTHEKCVELLSSGSTIADAMRDSGILNSQDGKMLSIGFKSGKGETAMAEIARRNEIKLTDKMDKIVGKIEPTLVIISSAIIGVILLSVMLPLMGIMTAIG
jgi:type IV pilus assembly protein PilC